MASNKEPGLQKRLQGAFEALEEAGTTEPYDPAALQRGFNAVSTLAEQGLIKGVFSKEGMLEHKIKAAKRAGEIAVAMEDEATAGVMATMEELNNSTLEILQAPKKRQPRQRKPAKTTPAKTGGAKSPKPKK